MFTGIVSHQGRIINTQSSESGLHAQIEILGLHSEFALGASIAFDGVCLTVTACSQSESGTQIDVDISPETLDVTTLSGWQVGDIVNIEGAMKIGDEIGGHIVSGHVDGLAKIHDIKELGENRQIKLIAPEALSKFIAAKGSVCLNGTSMTVNQVSGNEFSINVIPHTFQVTNWGRAKKDDQVNLEIDMLARYVARLREFDA